MFIQSFVDVTTCACALRVLSVYLCNELMQELLICARRVLFVCVNWCRSCVSERGGCCLCDEWFARVLGVHSPEANGVTILRPMVLLP
jgi:hypothetical protein